VAELQRGKTFPSDIETLRQLRAEVARLKAQCAELKSREEELDRQIAKLAAGLSPDVRALLDAEPPGTVPPTVASSKAEVARLSEEAVREVDQWERQE
jgi:hypothetical protein